MVKNTYANGLKKLLKEKIKMILEAIFQNGKIFIQFAKGLHRLEVSHESQSWNIVEINKFLINLATKTPDGEQIKFVYDQDLVQTNKIYQHICLLFDEFVKKYNDELVTQTN